MKIINLLFDFFAIRYINTMKFLIHNTKNKNHLKKKKDDKKEKKNY